MPREHAQYRYAGQHYIDNYGLNTYTASNPIPASDSCRMKVTHCGKTLIDREVIAKNADNTAFIVKIGSSETQNWNGEYVLEKEIINAVADTHFEDRTILVYEK